MASGPELERFLAQLGERRERVLELAAPSNLQSADLLAELNELSQQLIVADEELRVQQEELERARAALVAMGARQQLLSPDQHSVLTDRRGVVVMSTPSVQQLIRQPAVRLTPRPIATWFDVADRRVIRGLIGGVSAVGDRGRADAVRIRATDGELVTVAVSVEGVADPADGQLLLRWQLFSEVERHLRAVPRPDEGELTRLRPELPLELAEAAAELDACTTSEELVAAITSLAIQVVPEADSAGVIVRVGRTVLGSRGSTDELAAAADSAQVIAESGPAIRALAESRPVRHGDLTTESWLQFLPGPRHEWPSAALSVPLVGRERPFGVLTLYAARPDSFDSGSEVAALALAERAMLALNRLTEASGLREAIESRQLIGRAMGILVERHQLTPDSALAMLTRRSLETHVKLRDIARLLVETGQDSGQIPPS